jgi:hypothetical protein
MRPLTYDTASNELIAAGLSCLGMRWRNAGKLYSKFNGDNDHYFLCPSFRNYNFVFMSQSRRLRIPHAQFDGVFKSESRCVIREEHNASRARVYQPMVALE